MKFEDYKKWWNEGKTSSGASSDPAGASNSASFEDPLESTSGSSGSSGSSNSTSQVRTASESDDLNIKALINEFERLKESITQDTEVQTNALVSALSGVEIGIGTDVNAGASRVAGAVSASGAGIESKLSGMGTALTGIGTGIGNAATQAHADAENISKAIGDLAKAVNGSGSVQEVNVNGSGVEPPSSTQIESVENDRVSAAKSRFNSSWSDLRTSFSSIFSISLSGSGNLPKWNWVILGKNIVLDFNDYATELNWIGIAGVLFASISAIFIVFDK